MLGALGCGWWGGVVLKAGQCVRSFGVWLVGWGSSESRAVC